MRKPIKVMGVVDAAKVYPERVKYYKSIGFTVKEEDEYGCVVEKFLKHAGVIITRQLSIEDGQLFEYDL